MASSSISTRVIMPRRSKRVQKGRCDQAMTNPDSSAGIRTKEMDNSTETGVTRKRNAEDSSTKSRKKGTAARNERFEERYRQLIDFIDEFGHCNVPFRYSVDPSLGFWCGTMRSAYKKIQQGQTPKRSITEDQIARLEEIGFKWNIHETFEQRCHDLGAFKSEFGHCDVPSRYSADRSLGQWCSATRCAYNKIQQGQTPKMNLTSDQIERLEEIGFKWKLSYGQDTFAQRCHELEAFKSEFGHCNVPCKYSANPSLGKWCNTTRYCYNKSQQGHTIDRILTQDQIERLEEIGFKLDLANNTTFEQRYHDLEAFKSEFGHCNVTSRFSVHPSLGKWCIRMRYTHNQIQKGQTPKRNLTQDQIERLEEIGFKWKLR
jgi:hypothetical protein